MNMSANNPNNWISLPKSESEINKYIDSIFEHAGDNLWTKILKPAVQEDLQKQFAALSEGDDA